jgi:hypothetical protein
MRFRSLFRCLVGIFNHLFGVAVHLLGLAFNLQVDSFDFLRFAVHQLACGFLYFAGDTFLLRP